MNGVNIQFGLDGLLALLLTTVRITSFVLLAPPFSYRGFPTVVKVLLSVGLALAISPPLPDQLAGQVTAGPLVAAILAEVVIGAALGFLCLLVFAAVQAAGDLLDIFGGFSVAFQYDPLTQVGSSVLARMYQLTALALLFASNAHLLILRGLVRTFQVLPLGGVLDLPALGRAATTGIGQMFLAALQIAGPIIVVLFLADVGLGLLTRVAPALNPFALGFPLKILITLIIVGLAFTVLPQVIESLATELTRLFVGVAGS